MAKDCLTHRLSKPALTRCDKFLIDIPGTKSWNQPLPGTHIVSSRTIKAVRKDVLAKCYGGDISRPWDALIGVKILEK